MGWKALGWRSEREDGGPHTRSATGSKTQKLKPEQRSARAPQPLNHPALVEVQHIGVMCAARYSQGTHRRGAHLKSQHAAVASRAAPHAVISHAVGVSFGVLLREEKIKIGKNCPLL